MSLDSPLFCCFILFALPVIPVAFIMEFIVTFLFCLFVCLFVCFVCVCSACFLFELLTGDYLFDPKDDPDHTKGYSKDEGQCE